MRPARLTSLTVLFRDSSSWRFSVFDSRAVAFVCIARLIIHLRWSIHGGNPQRLSTESPMESVFP
jgi:hypothetical protein